jgi:hypothetical protein
MCLIKKMRYLIISTLCLGLAYQTAFGEVFGDFEYMTYQGAITISKYNGAGGAVVIPSEINGQPVTGVFDRVFWRNTTVTSVTVPNSVTWMGLFVFEGANSLTSLTIPDWFITALSYPLCVPGPLATEMLDNYIANKLANNDAFIATLANKIIAKSGNYGLSVKSELGTLASKAELTSSLAQSRTDGINSVLSNPNLWTLYTTSQIQNMAVGDLVLTRQVNGIFVLNYDIEQSADLQTWTPYQALSLPLTGLPTDKAFVRIKAKQ